jgi:hypothetical protein
VTVVEQPGVERPLPATVTPAAHSVGIVGVDFDPDLNAAQILSNGAVTLMVAVENQGQNTETELALQAELRAGDGQTAGKLFDETIVLKDLRPGEVRVVRFTPVSDLPLLRAYNLLVDLRADSSDANPADNMRQFEIRVEVGE